MYVCTVYVWEETWHIVIDPVDLHFKIEKFDKHPNTYRFLVVNKMFSSFTLAKKNSRNTLYFTKYQETNKSPNKYG